MARIEFKPGIRCKRCGNMDIPPFSSILCQKCGAKIVEGYNKKDGYTITANANIISIKITHKLFKDIYEEVL